MKLLFTFFVMTLIGGSLYSDDLLNPYMNNEEYSAFIE